MTTKSLLRQLKLPKYGGLDDSILMLNFQVFIITWWLHKRLHPQQIHTNSLVCKNKAYTLKILCLDPVSQPHNSAPRAPRPNRQQMFSHSWIHPPRGISYFCKLTHVLHLLYIRVHSLYSVLCLALF